MKKIFYMAALLLLQLISNAQVVKPLVLYGAIEKENLMENPFSEWFVTNYNAYQPNETICNSIKKLNTKGVTIEIFMGTWCGDSKREVPRFYKLLDKLSFPLQQVKLIGLGGDSLVKQSPQHEEEGKGVFRVPTFIIYKDGVEINRINEYPAFSLEKDLLSILNNQLYSPNYKGFAAIKNWLTDGSLLEVNNNTNGLAAQLRPLVMRETELNSLGRLLMEQGKKEEGLKILQINASIFPELATVYYNLGDAYYKMGDNKNAALSLEKSLELNKDPQLVKIILKLLYEVKELRG